MEYKYNCIVLGKIRGEVIQLANITAEVIRHSDMDGRDTNIRVTVLPDTINCCKYILESAEYGDGYQQRFLEGLESVIEMGKSASAETHRLWDYYEAEVYYTCELLPKLKYRIRSWANNCFLYINEYKK